MFDELKKLWSNNKWKFILLLVPILIASILKAIAWFVKASADRTMKSAVETGDKLRAETDSLDAKAKSHMAKADELAGKKHDDDPDWNTR